MEFCKVGLTFESVDKTLRRDYSNETSLRVHSPACCYLFFKILQNEISIFCRILPLGTFGSERVNHGKEQHSFKFLLVKRKQFGTTAANSTFFLYGLTCHLNI